MIVRRGALLNFPAENVTADAMKEVRVEDAGGLLQGRKGYRHLQVCAAHPLPTLLHALSERLSEKLSKLVQ